MSMLQIFVSYGQVAAAVVALVMVAQSAYASFKNKNYKVMTLLIIVTLLFLSFLYNTLWTRESCSCNKDKAAAPDKSISKDVTYETKPYISTQPLSDQGKDGKMAIGLL
jgi:NADH:ubiquinone oxidoreductase subunit 6 (subunit J)